MDLLVIRWLRGTGPWAVLDPLDGISHGSYVTGTVKSCCSVVVRYDFLFFPLKKISFDQGGYNSTNASRAWAFLTSVAVRIMPWGWDKR